MGHATMYTLILRSLILLVILSSFIYPGFAINGLDDGLMDFSCTEMISSRTSEQQNKNLHGAGSGVTKTNSLWKVAYYHCFDRKAIVKK